MNEDRVHRELPPIFCWTRFGHEAGEAIERIVERKENERLANGGVFYWGVGNAVGPGILELLRRTASPEVLFSPIRSRPREVDVSPAFTVRWQWAEDLSGDAFPIPATIRVTSRGTSSTNAGPHYALVCSATQPLEPQDLGTLRFGELRNLRTGSAVGPSQVTAVVRREEDPGADGAEYVVALRVALVAPYFVRLRAPIVHDQNGKVVSVPRRAQQTQLQFS